MARLEGIDAEHESFDERSEYTVARRYMDYDIRGQASNEERAWLHAHPVLWLRALKQAMQDAHDHSRRAKRDLFADPRKPSGPTTAEIHLQWKEIKAEAARVESTRQHFIAKVRERIALVRELLPADRLDLLTVNTLVPRLLDIELLIRNENSQQARIELARIIVLLAENGDGPAGRA